ncbi:MAG TPA: GtrA family protein [Burkholderiales bacterium]|nr:GtrA family protein [Burkholderiales bacterium]
MQQPLPESRPQIAWPSQFLRFAGAGIFGTTAHYLVLLGLVEIAGINAVAASFLGFVCGALVNYALSRRYIFNSALPHRQALLKFFGVALVGLCLNTLIMLVGVETLGLHYFLVQLAATGMVLIWNFAGNKFWTFREKT